LSLEQVPCLLGPSSLSSFPENKAAYLNLHIPHNILDRIRRHASITRNWFFFVAGASQKSHQSKHVILKQIFWAK
jgi:hypothetical protein